MIKILFFGDIVGEIGREAFYKKLPSLKKDHQPDLIIVNGENLANGKGITPHIYHQLLDSGVDCITSGNHVFDNKDIIEQMEEYTHLIRPLNYPNSVPGNSSYSTTIQGITITILNVLGQVFLPPIDSPFHTTEKFLENINSDIILIDIHAEATSEKKAFAYHFQNKVSAIVGTHTHVQTNDAEIINEHTAYITDVGMIGAKNSIIGMKPEPVLRRFLTSMPERFAPPKKDDFSILNYVEIIIEKTGKAKSIIPYSLTIKNELG
ncbi:MAG: TIGR00282 family metallophosphoesterase [Candidatus Margulisbacteria bacterium]|nr:TIGR00282 family metallophosphoesterase [Candidatus Margulisiibacteriota bacterium]